MRGSGNAGFWGKEDWHDHATWPIGDDGVRE
jgi:hypothetical protein